MKKTLSAKYVRGNLVLQVSFESNSVKFKSRGLVLISVGLSAHMKYHSEEKSFKCDRLNCDAAFKNKYSLKNHIKTHLNVRKHECKNCDKKFMKADHLRRHERCHTVIKSSFDTS